MVAVDRLVRFLAASDGLFSDDKHGKLAGDPSVCLSGLHDSVIGDAWPWRIRDPLVSGARIY